MQTSSNHSSRRTHISISYPLPPTFSPPKRASNMAHIDTLPPELRIKLLELSQDISTLSMRPQHTTAPAVTKLTLQEEENSDSLETESVSLFMSPWLSMNYMQKYLHKGNTNSLLSMVLKKRKRGLRYGRVVELTQMMHFIDYYGFRG